MPLRELLMKTIGIVLFAVGTLLALHAESRLAVHQQFAKFILFASIISFLVGSLFFVFPMARDLPFMQRMTGRRDDRRKPGAGSAGSAGSASLTPPRPGK
jgi:hypothetical protein